MSITTNNRQFALVGRSDKLQNFDIQEHENSLNNEEHLILGENEQSDHFVYGIFMIFLLSFD